MSPAPAGEAAAERFFDELRDAHEAAAEAAGDVRERHFRIAGSHVALRLAGEAPEEPFTAALAHLACEPVYEPDLTVLVFDTDSTGVRPPTAPWQPGQVREAGVVEAFSGPRFRTVLQIAVEMLSMVDRDSRTAVCWVRDAAGLPMPERAAPMRRLLQGWLADRGLVLAHAAAVGTAGGGVLLTGRGGVGKSCTALACLDSPLLYAADDYCAVDPGAAPWVHSLYGTGKAHAADVESFPLLGPMVANPDELPREKAVFHLHRHLPQRLSAGFPLRAILLPRVEERTALEPVSGGAVMRALAPTSVLLSPQNGAPTLTSLADLVRRLPSYELRLGPDRSETPGVIADLLEELGAPSDAPAKVPA